MMRTIIGLRRPGVNEGRWMARVASGRALALSGAGRENCNVLALDRMDVWAYPTGAGFSLFKLQLG